MAKGSVAPTKSNPVPIQRPNFRPEDLAPEGGLAYFNQFMDQIVNAANLANGAVGPSVLPAGVDVAGGKLTGLAKPENPTDAVSLSHANSSYSAPALGPQLDLGGPSALKGLTGLQLQFNQLTQSGASGTVVLAKLTGGGSNGSLTFKNGIVTAFTAPS